MNGTITTLRPGWTRRAVLKAAGSTALAVSAAGLARPGSRSAWAATQRPIAEFVDAQGTTFVFVPPVGDFVGWVGAVAAPPGYAASVDYAGLADEYLGGLLGTTTGGSITERPLGDGRAEYTVNLQTSNALAWAIPFDPTSTANQFGENPLLFGYRAPEVGAGAEAALAGSHLQVVFRHFAGAPMPDLTRDLFVAPDPDLELVSISFQASAAGPLRALFGVPEGTPGRCAVTQTGVLFRGPFRGATADGFPAERVDLRAVGQ